MSLEIRVSFEDDKPKLEGLPENYSVNTLARDSDGILYLILCNSPERAEQDAALRRIKEEEARICPNWQDPRDWLPKINEYQPKGRELAEQQTDLLEKMETFSDHSYEFYTGKPGEVLAQPENILVRRYTSLMSTNVMYGDKDTWGVLYLPGPPTPDPEQINGEPTIRSGTSGKLEKDEKLEILL